MGVHASFGRIKISLKWQYEIVCNSWIIISYVMEKEVLVLMLLSVFSLMSVALSPTKNYILERQMLDACGIQAIANISRMQWQSSKDHVLRGYDFAYDGLNRLEESTYAEGAGMSQNKNRYSEKILSFSPNGSIECLQRYGKKNNGTFGLIDDLTYSYNGNQIKAISDKAGSLLYNGSFDFKDGANADVEYFYDANGALVKDLNKGISNIEYDVLGNLYGHAYFYELKQKNPSIEPSHTFGVVGYVKEFDPYFNQVVSYPAFGKNNTELEEQINIVEQQAIDNYEKNNR